MNCNNPLLDRLADISTDIVDGIFKMFLTLLLIRSMIQNNLQRSPEELS